MFKGTLLAFKMPTKTRKNFRFTDKTVELIDSAASATGLTQTDLLELLISDHLPDVVKNLSDSKVSAMKLALKEFQKRVK